MAKPLFTAEELASYKESLQKLEKDHREQGAASSFATYWAERENIEEAHQLEMVRRAQSRAREYLHGLIILAGSRGHTYVPFNQLFASSDKPVVVAKVEEYNMPQTRRTLHTILKALTEVPHNWATSAFIRFLRGTGKQRGAKFSGAGLLGADYGWKEDEVAGICKPITQERDPYSRVLMSYTDLTEVEAEMKTKNPDYEVETDLRFASHVQRDKVFLQTLCEMLEREGLADIPTPAVKEPQGPRIPKVFKPGDVIRKATMRDLPLPAHVRVSIERLPAGMRQFDAKPEDWTPSTLDQVVTRIGNAGLYYFASIGPDPGVAHGDRFNWENKGFLDGALYVGSWKGKIVTTRLQIKFQFRKPEKSKGKKNRR